MSKGMAMKCLTGIYFEEKYEKTKFRIQKIARMFEHPTRHSKATLENVQTFSPTFEPLLSLIVGSLSSKIFIPFCLFFVFCKIKIRIVFQNMILGFLV